MADEDRSEDARRAAAEARLATGSRRAAHLDPALHERAVAQMREEQAEAIRRRTLFLWIAVPCLIASLAGSLLLDRSEHAVLAYASDLVACAAAWVLWRSNRERLRDLIGR